MKKWIPVAVLAVVVIGIVLTATLGTRKNDNDMEENTMTVIHVTKDNFQEVVLNSDKPVLVDFWASWCGPCRMVAPILDEIAQEREDIVVCKINVDEEPELASQYGIMSIPTLLVFENGEIVNQAVGAKPKSGILALIDD